MLRDFSLVEIEDHSGSVYGLWPDLTLAYLSPSWFAFSQQNDGHPAIADDWGVGRSVLDAIPQVLSEFYAKLYADALTHNPALRPATHTYECSSARQFRRFAMHLYPLRDAAGLLIVNSLLVEAPCDIAARPPHGPSLEAYQDHTGTIRQCAHCRRIQRVGEARRWDWVPEWVDTPPAAASHALCGICLDYYYPEAGPRSVPAQ